MAFAAGTRLGPYQIVAPLGAGGMGEVYKARDTRLDRTVAIKILAPSLASDPDFRERFDREGRAISQLDHPNICALYDVGQHDGTAFLVMQYLDGETLAERLQKGALPVPQALECATQIADALAIAHRAGFIHRDLKPANVMLTKTGARLLDFGLAKSTAPVQASPPHSTMPTTAAGLTAQGTILGTFHYMAPEQIEGAEADRRGDIWAFGCVLYEMLTGARPFSGKSHASLIASIIGTEPPPVPERQPQVGRAIDHVIRRCLAKDPDARWQSMIDVAHELRWASADENGSRSAGRSWSRQPAVYVALGLIAVAAAIAWRMPASPPARTPSSSATLTFIPPAGLTLTPFGSAGTPQFALSPDGRRIAFVASAVGRPPRLWIRPIESRVGHEVPGSDDASSPFWSSDSASIGFFAEGKLKTIGVEGERPRIVTTVIDPAGATWHGDDILVGRGADSIMRISTSGGPPQNATVFRSGGGGHRWPQFLSDGRHFIYAESRGSVMLAALDSNESTELIDARATAVFDPDGFLLFVRSGRLMAQPLDLTSFKPIGTAYEVLDSARYAVGSGFPAVSVTKTGLLAYWDGTTVETDLAWFDRAGNPLTSLPVPRPPPSGRGIDFAIAPDGRQVAFTLASEGSASSIWLMGASGDSSRVPTHTDSKAPIWSRDGSQILFTSASTGRLSLFRRAINGDEKEQNLGTVPFAPEVVPLAKGSYATDWSTDGRVALLTVTQPATGRDVAAYAIDTGQLTPVFASAASEIQPRFSPDGRWIAYASNETGRWEVFVEPFPPTGSRKQVSTEGGSQPVWRRDGKELFFLAPDRKLMTVSVTPGTSFAPGSPRALFETRMRPTYPPYPVNYDATLEGQRFLIDSARPHTGPTISIVVNWSAAARPR